MAWSCFVFCVLLLLLLFCFWPEVNESKFSWRNGTTRMLLVQKKVRVWSLPMVLITGNPLGMAVDVVEASMMLINLVGMAVDVVRASMMLIPVGMAVDVVEASMMETFSLVGCQYRVPRNTSVSWLLSKGTHPFVPAMLFNGLFVLQQWQVVGLAVLLRQLRRGSVPCVQRDERQYRFIDG